MVKPKIFVQGDMQQRNVFLTSGFQLPFQEGDLLEQVDNASLFQGFASGGAILHLFLNEKIPTEQQIKMFKSILSNYPIFYLTKTPFLTTCNNCSHRMVGKHTKCEKCGSEDVTLWSRPIGYFRPVMRGKVSKDYRNANYVFWLSGRIEDFATRKEITKEDVEHLIAELSEQV